MESHEIYQIEPIQYYQRVSLTFYNSICLQTLADRSATEWKEPIKSDSDELNQLEVVKYLMLLNAT